MRFASRKDAGRRLAAELTSLRDVAPVVLALPRGGVPVAAEVASALGAPLDVLVVRRLGHPRRRELGVGALGEGGVMVLDDALLERLGVAPQVLRPVIDEEQAELQRRIARYRGSRPSVPIAGRTVVLVDDGLATGVTARAAIEVLREAGAGRVVLAVPVAPADTVRALGGTVEVVCVTIPEPFRAVGEGYEDFRPVGDDEVVHLLAEADGRVTAASDCGATAERTLARPALPGSYEELFHRAGILGVTLGLGDRSLPGLRRRRLEPAVGVA